MGYVQSVKLGLVIFLGAEAQKTIYAQIFRLSLLRVLIHFVLRSLCHHHDGA
jgi:hypothetical protein